MLSILIPVYNQSVVQLVKDLKGQCERIDIEFQIMVLDDLSKEEFRKQNRDLAHELGVNYHELTENIGRAKIRNRLARMARYKHLLFLDGDSGIVRKDFVQRYIDQMENAEVVYGGRVYQSEKPADPDLILHWEYGRTREALPLKNRQLDPFLNFQSNNFMISASLFSRLKFDEEVEGYGYEDLLFAQKIRGKGESIIHIDNPVEHQGLEPAKLFIEKTRNAVKNLVLLNKAGDLKDTRLTKFYNSMKNKGMKNVLVKYIDFNRASILKNLTSKNPKIWKFNLLKLAEYDRAMSHS